MAKLGKAQELILAILSELEESGIRAQTLTSLVKFVYLVDYSVAKETGGLTHTSLDWRFLHFGPFDAAVMRDIDTLESLGRLNRISGGGTSKDYQLYSLNESISRFTLEAVGVTKRAAMRAREYFQEYASDQSKLLNFVYFETEPMEAAEPEQVLDFSLCRADKWQDVKPLKATPIPSGALKTFRERLAARHAAEDARRTSPIVWHGQYDAMYHDAMARLDATGKFGDNLAGSSAILAL